MTADAQAHYARWVLAPSRKKPATAARGSYFLCGVPRSGTWLLAGLLDSTGVAGHPHEYFWRDSEETNRVRWGLSSFAAYVAAVKEAGTSSNGIFGAKLMWGYLGDFLDRLRALAGERAASDRELIERFFPLPRFVFIWREDVAAQAVSWSKAIQTGCWHHWDTPADVEPCFDFEQIDALAQEAEAHHASWRRWFADNEIDAFGVRHEDLVSDMEGSTREVLEFLGIDSRRARSWGR